MPLVFDAVIMPNQELLLASGSDAYSEVPDAALDDVGHNQQMVDFITIWLLAIFALGVISGLIMSTILYRRIGQ